VQEADLLPAFSLHSHSDAVMGKCAVLFFNSLLPILRGNIENLFPHYIAFCHKKFRFFQFRCRSSKLDKESFPKICGKICGECE